VLQCERETRVYGAVEENLSDEKCLSARNLRTMPRLDIRSKRTIGKRRVMKISSNTSQQAEPKTTLRSHTQPQLCVSSRLLCYRSVAYDVHRQIPRSTKSTSGRKGTVDNGEGMSQSVRQELVGFLLTLPEGTRHVTCASWTHQSPSAAA
jgi:hypothetical protein